MRKNVQVVLNDEKLCNKYVHNDVKIITKLAANSQSEL